MEELYSKEILRLASAISRTGRLAQPDCAVVRTSRICGSRLSLDLKFDGDQIADLAQEVKACAVGQAICSWAAQNFVGLRIDALQALADGFEDMLKNGGPVPEGFPDLEIFRPVHNYRARHGAAMLPFDAIREAFATVAS